MQLIEINLSLFYGGFIDVGLLGENHHILKIVVGGVSY